MAWWSEEDLISQRMLWQQLIDFHSRLVKTSKGKAVDDTNLLTLYPSIGVDRNLCSSLSLLCKALLKERGDTSFGVDDCLRLGCPVAPLCAEAIRILNMTRRAIQFNLGKGGCESEEQREHTCVNCSSAAKCMGLEPLKRIPLCLAEIGILAVDAQSFIDDLPEFKGL